ncbi:MAG: zinc ribbon domain-containing protein [Vicinamibacterales bacterium]
MSSATSTDPGLRPWQLFLLAGMLAATAVVLVSKGQPLSSVVVLSLTVVASSFVAVAGYRSLAPLFAVVDPDDEQPVTGRARAALEREKALVLRTIKEIEFDHAMGKTASGDFEEMRDRLKVRAIGLMRQLETSDYRAVVEHDLAARTGQTAPVSAPAPVPAAAVPAPQTVATIETGPIPMAASVDLPAPSSPAPAPAAAPPRTGRRVVQLCGACDGVNDVDARFCKHCGAALTEAEA